MTEHLAFDQMSELADGALSPSVESATRTHLRACESCASRFAAITALRVSTANLPREIAVPDDLWPAIHGAISQRRGPAWSWSGRQLAAAGIAIAVLSSAITGLTLLGRGAPGDTDAANGTAPVTATAVTAADAAPAELPARLAMAESRYAANASALQRTLNERRGSLSPATIAIVERSLRVSDSAIAEARGALARDPGNRALAALFASNYERKIDLLRRATELANTQ